MQMLMWLLLSAAQAAPLPAGPVAQGAGPEFERGSFPAHRWSQVPARLDAAWEFAKALGTAPAGLKPPKMVFYGFDPSVQDPAFTRWQAAWLAAHPEVPQPFPKGFRGFHYDGTGVIQIDPATTFFNPRFFRNGPDGRKKDYVGYGYYVSLHEMLHYVLENRGIPGEMHHCLYIRPRTPGEPAYTELIAGFVADSGWGNAAALRRWASGEEAQLDPCGETPKTFFRSAKLRRLRDAAQAGYLQAAGVCGGWQRRLWFNPREEAAHRPAVVNYFLQMETERPLITVIQRPPEDPAAAVRRAGEAAGAAAFMRALAAEPGLEMLEGMRALRGEKGVIEQHYIALIDADADEALLLGGGRCHERAPSAR